ncbi:MAG: tRNA pseudouridine(55) synthase TruB [Alphaproteobacteria bacterium]
MARERRGRPIHGWLVIDKPAGMTSARVVARVKRITGAAKAGHGGTLDPMATGVLPLALGEATKTVAYVMGSLKTYRFTVCWGEARVTDDADGEVIETCEMRPDAAAIRAALPVFTGAIEQVPPAFAAIKVNGERAYRLAREGRPVALAPRAVFVDRLDLVEIVDPDHAVFEMRCGKGTYVRALARDLARHLGTVGHLARLRRTVVGGFRDDEAISLDKLETLVHSGALLEHLRPVETALADIPALAVTEAQADRVRSGQSVTALGGDPGMVRVIAHRRLVALAEVKGDRVHPVRVFNLTD